MPKDDTHTARIPSYEASLCAEMVSMIGSNQFFDELACALDDALPFKWLHIFLYSKDKAPTNLSSKPQDIDHKRGLQNYLNFTYVINPTYRAFQARMDSGVYLISDFIQDGHEDAITSADFEIRIDDSEPIGYRTPGWPKGMEEFIVLINLPNDTAVDFTFLVEKHPQEIATHRSLLKNIFHLLNAVLVKQFEIFPNSYDHNSRPGQEDKFQDFGSDILTDREREVVQLVLVGHNSSSIAAKLNISLSTIKTHRRNIYSKLQISSQVELFSLFLLHLR
jgi:DNA-binding CsgD family transcriptional regulator